MKRFLHALAALWPKGREHEGPWLPDARNGLLRHAADVMRMEEAIEELMVGTGKLSSSQNQHPPKETKEEPLLKREILPIDESDNSDTGNTLAMGNTLAQLYLQNARAQNETTEESTDTTSEPNVKRHFPMPLMSVFLALFMCLLAVQQVSAQSEPAAAAAGGNIGEDQRQIITGVVVDTLGQAIEGATVRIQGTSQQTQTDEYGRFSLRAVENSGTLRVRFVGYHDTETSFTIPSLEPILLELMPLENIIEEVEVSTGYQNVSKERFVGSASILDSASFHSRVGMGILERMDGRVSGVLFDKKMGVTDQFQVRGISTFGGQFNAINSKRPLIILDNFPFDGNLDDINPNDVENITVLKDAAAASIWGARAGNGVVVITTKQGHVNRPFRITFRSNIGADEKPNLFYYPRMSSSEFIEVEHFLHERGYFDNQLSNSDYPYSWPVVSPVVELLDQVDKGLVEGRAAERQIEEFARTDYRSELMDHWYQPSYLQQYYLNVSGGSDKYGYSLSTGYDNSSSNIRNGGGRQTFTLASNNTFRPLNKFVVDVGLNYSLTDDRSVGHLLGSKQYPYQTLVDVDGQPAAVPTSYRMTYIDTVGMGQLLDWHLRPLEEVGKVDNLARSQLLRANVGLRYNILPWLDTELRYQYSGRQTSNRDHSPLESWYARDIINRFTNLNETVSQLRYPVPMGGILDLENGLLASHHYRAQLKAEKNWGNDYSLSALVATERFQTQHSGYSTRIYGYNDDIGTYQSNIDFNQIFPMYHSTFVRSTVPQGAGIRSGSLTRNMSFLGNVSYTHKRKYTIYGSARRDGSNLFGVETNNKWKPLWSIGGSWEISQEPISLPSVIERLRLRASYGYTGNVINDISGYPTMSYLPVTSRNLNELPLAQLQNPPNPNLRWEQVRTVNLGADFQLWKGRINGGFEWFDKKSTDLISTVPFDPTSGVSAYTVNAASLKGNGFEVNLSSVNLTGRLRWESNFNISYSKMIVTEVHDGGYRARDFINYGLHPSEGRVAYGVSSYRWSGLDPENGNPRGYLDGAVSTNYMEIFNDDVENQMFHGSAIPLYSGYLFNSLQWHGITLSFNLSYRAGFYFRQPTINYSSLFNGVNLHADYSQRWKKPGDENNTHVPSMIYPIPADVALRNDFYNGSEVHVKRGDNLRLQDLRIAYSLTHKSGGQIDIFLYGNNLNVILAKAYDGRLDADYTGGNNLTAAPIPRSWMLGVNIGF